MEDGLADRRSLPVELIFECYRLLFPPCFFNQGSLLEKPSWKDIQGLTLASKESREIILSLWFHVLCIANTEDWKIVLWRWKRLYQWTRAIHYTSTAYKTPRSLLEPFIRLNTLRIDLPPTHVTEAGDFDFAAPELAQIIHEGIPGPAIRYLEIRGITWLDPFVMRHFAEGLPNLRTLILRQPLVWCGLCNTIGAPSFKLIPGRLVYDDGMGLPDGYSRYLAPLQHLHTVILTVACGEGGIVYDALFSNEPSQQGVTNQPVCGPPTRQPPPNALSNTRKYIGWSGECEDCMRQLLDDNTFRDTWAARKTQEAQPQTIGQLPVVRNRPPSLCRVEWNLLDLSHENWPGLLPTTVMYDM